LATESLLTFRIDSYTIKGFIDRLSRRGNAVYEIHDYKTSGSLPTQEKFDNDRQLALYQIGVRERFRDAKDIRLIWHYLTFDQEFTSARTEAQLKDLKKQVVLLIKAIEKDTRFEPVESALCDWCDYPEYCPARKHEIKVSDMPPNKYLKEKGVTLVNKFASIKAEIKELQDKIEGRREELDQVSQAAVEYAKKEEITNITGSDFILKVAEFTERCFPRSGQEGREELEMFIKKMGIWEQVSGLTLSKLSKLIDDETLKSKIRNGLLKFAEEEDKVSIRLMKRRDTDE
jgi:putative RecB family exonuclease